ncbi:MAG: ABC transporter ATP-binding protein [Campylobacter sp.]|nr:ABC transporter ATP-binding protein [Campylobacter sp.]
MIEIINLNKSYGSNQILKDLNLKINSGEFVVLLGASGSGKSTLLSILSARNSFDSGVIKINSQSFTNKIPPNKSRQLLTQNYSLMPWQSAIGNVKFAMNCAKKDSKNASDFLTLVGLENRQNAHPNSLSGGERQRVAIARALAIDPDILFMDEPFAALDPIIRANLQKELKKMTRDKTVIFVTHDIDEAVILSDKIVVLKDGKIVLETQNPKLTPYSQNAIEFRSKLLRTMVGEYQQIEYEI